MRHKEPSILRLLIIIGLIVLAGVLLHQNGYARTITVDPGELADSLAVATAGDSVVLADGYHDSLVVSGLSGSAGSPIYIIAENKYLATFSYGILTNCDYLYIKDIYFYPWSSGGYIVPPSLPIAPATGENGLALIDIDDDCSHIYLDGIKAEATTNVFSTLSAWQDSGFYAAILSYADSLTLSGGIYRDGRYNVSCYGDSLLVTGILSERFSEDGLRVGNYSTVTYNTIRDAYTPDADYHGDLMQWSFGVPAYDITVKYNEFLAVSNDRGNTTFLPITQGVFADQGTYGFDISNNVIVVRQSAWSIGIYNCSDGVILNNTTAAIDTVNETHCIVLVGEKNGGTSDSVHVAYNIAQQFWNEASGDSVFFWSNYDYEAPNIYVHNYIAQWDIFRDPSSNDFYPADSTVAIVDPTDSTIWVTFPTDDIVGVTRDATPDIGAYERDAAVPEEPDGGTVIEAFTDSLIAGEESVASDTTLYAVTNQSHILSADGATWSTQRSATDAAASDNNYWGTREHDSGQYGIYRVFSLFTIPESFSAGVDSAFYGIHATANYSAIPMSAHLRSAPNYNTTPTLADFDNWDGFNASGVHGGSALTVPDSITTADTLSVSTFTTAGRDSIAAHAGGSLKVVSLTGLDVYNVAPTEWSGMRLQISNEIISLRLVTIDGGTPADTLLSHAAVTNEPDSVLFDGVKGTEVSAYDSVDTANEWYFDESDSTLYVLYSDAHTKEIVWYYTEAEPEATTTNNNTNSWGGDTNSWADKPSWGTAW